MRNEVLTMWGIGAVMVLLGGCNKDDSSDTKPDSDTHTDGNDSDTGEVTIHWDWVGVVGTGQSLAVGEMGRPPLSTSPLYNNLKLSTGSLTWPVDPEDSALEMVPLVELVGRSAPDYPSSWPTNISGETPHTAMANQITALVEAVAGSDYIGVHGEFGENGQCMEYLKKDPAEDDAGINGRAFEATLVETAAVARLAKEAGATHGVGAVIVTHGECDAGNRQYEDELHQLWEDYNTKIQAITGQSETIQMIVSQQHSTNDNSASTLAQWKVGVDHPESIVCSGPKYQYPYAADGTHLNAEGYRRLGEKYGQVYFKRVVLGLPWQPLQPVEAARNGRFITVTFDVPVPPLVFDEALPPPHQGDDEWKAGQGFEVSGYGGTKLPIESVEIDGSTVKITCAEDLPSNVTVGYAMVSDADKRMTVTDPDDSGEVLWTGTRRWGRLRDSDPFVGDVTGVAQPNWCVAFEMSVD